MSACNAQMAFEIAHLDATAQAELVRSGALTPAELTEAAIIRAEHMNPDLNALSWRAFDQARDMAGRARTTGRFCGVPYLLKDSCDYPGFPRRSASRSRSEALMTAGFPFTDALRAGGLIPIGMSTMPEFGLLTSGEAVRYSVTKNPWNPGITCGGSSSGAGSAVAGGIVPLAQGSDAAGSIRIPAACNGVVGLKASRGANKRARAPHFADDMLCSDGLLARSVRDVAGSFALTARSNAPEVTAPVNRPLRIGIVRTDLNGKRVASELQDALTRTAKLCEGLGHRVEEITLPLDGPAVIRAIKTLWAYEGGDIVDATTERFPDTPITELLESWTIGLKSARDAMMPEDLTAANAMFATSAAAMAEVFNGFDILLSPALPEPPAAVGRFSPMRPFAEMWQTVFDFVSLTPLQNISGLPAISLPLATDAAATPLGMMFTAALGQDDLLLALALQLEEAAPWADRWPDVFLKAEKNAQQRKPLCV